MSPSNLRNFISEVIQQEASKITEPKRSGLSLDKLGLQPNGGVQNIIAVYNQATPEEKDYWGKWYHNAKTDVEDIASHFDLSFPVVAAIVATLSPGNKWNTNLLATERLISGIGKINSYPRQVKKAQQILATRDVSLVSGPKVSVFFQSLINPKAVEKDMVLDGHAMNIWRGIKVSLRDINYPNAKERAQMVDDYHTAAKELGVPVQAVQAVTWYIWKYTAKEGSEKSSVSLDEVNALGAGLVVGAGMGDGNKESKDLMWSGDEKLNESVFPDAPTDAGFVYHATVLMNAIDIKEDGEIVPHYPDFGTDQDTWPDGSTALRSYFGTSPKHVEPFYGEGKPVLLRIPISAAKFKKERGTGDIFTNQVIPTSFIEIWDNNTKTWMPIEKVQNMFAESVLQKVFSKINELQR